MLPQPGEIGLSLQIGAEWEWRRRDRFIERDRTSFSIGCAAFCIQGYSTKDIALQTDWN